MVGSICDLGLHAGGDNISIFSKLLSCYLLEIKALLPTFASGKGMMAVSDRRCASTVAK